MNTKPENAKYFAYAHGDTVVIEVSGEVGTVIARADYPAKEASYCVRYKAADGRACEAWWDESALILQ